MKVWVKKSLLTQTTLRISVFSISIKWWVLTDDEEHVDERVDGISEDLSGGSRRASRINSRGEGVR